jgi:hypothetical protein
MGSARNAGEGGERPWHDRVSSQTVAQCDFEDEPSQASRLCYVVHANLIGKITESSGGVFHAVEAGKNGSSVSRVRAEV